MVTITLIGALGDKFGRDWSLDIHSPGEAIRAIAAQIPAFTEYLRQSPTPYEIILDGSTIDETGFDRGILSSLSIVPVLAGSGTNAAVNRIITGAAILGASFFMPTMFYGLSSLSIGLFGAAMITGGIVDLLTPQPHDESSFMFDAAGVSRAIQGMPVPVLFGERFIQPVPISIWVDNENIRVDFIP